MTAYEGIPYACIQKEYWVNGGILSLRYLGFEMRNPLLFSTEKV